MKLIIFFLICFYCQLTQNNKIEDKMIWISQCDNTKVITTERKDEKLMIEVYGSIQLNDGDTMYYIAFAENIKESKDSIEFDIKNYKVSRNEIFNNPKPKYTVNKEMALLIPNHIRCTINSSEQKIEAQITMPTYFSRFDTCSFTLKQ